MTPHIHKPRTNEPIFWALFGAGGVVVAFILPMLIFITGVANPLGLLPDDALSYARVHAFAESWFGQIFLCVVIALSLWHGVHRIFLSLHDFGIEKKNWQRWILYGGAFVGSVVTTVLLLLV